MRKLPQKTTGRRRASALFVLFSLVLMVWSSLAYTQVRKKKSQARVLSEVEMMMAGAEANRVDVVLYFLKKGLDPNVTARDGTTALIVAAARGNAGIVDLLLTRGGDVNKANDAGWTPLMEAARRDQDRMVERLVKAGARFDVWESANGLTPLMVAVKGDRTLSVTAMLGAGADPRASDKKRGLTALHYALASRKFSSTEIVAELLVRGAKPGHKGNDGYTPLMAAVDSGKVAKASLILSERVDVEAETSDGRRALTIAAGNGQGPMVKYLLEAGAIADGGSGKFTALTQAIRIGAHEAASLLLDKDASPNRSAADGRPPLMLAARGGFDTIVKLLLDKGAKINGRYAKDGSTALMWAANNGHQRIVELLIDRGANAALTANDGWTAGAAARMAGHEEIANRLERQI